MTILITRARANLPAYAYGEIHRELNLGRNPAHLPVQRARRALECPGPGFPTPSCLSVAIRLHFCPPHGISRDSQPRYGEFAKGQPTCQTEFPCQRPAVQELQKTTGACCSPISADRKISLFT